MATKTRSEEVVEFLYDLHPNIVMEILARLPVKTIFASRCVCKAFLSLASPNPHFTALHNANAAQILILQFGDVPKPSNVLRLIEPEVDMVPELVRNFVLRPVFELPKIQTYRSIQYRSNFRDENKAVLVNSCNGLLYFARRDALDERSLVCNPVTNEYVVIPDGNAESRVPSETKSMWFGFSPSTNQYKVLRIFSSLNVEEPVLGAEVFVVGSNSLRDIKDRPLVGVELSWDVCSATVNGVMYWIHHSWRDIVSFDFEREVFGVIALPVEFGEEELPNERFLSIGVLRGCLCLSYNAYSVKRLDIWIMRKHGDQESWSKEFVVHTERPYGKQLYGSMRPIQILRNGEILFHWVIDDLVCYDPKNNSLRIVGFCFNPRLVGFTPSFIPLKDALSVDKVTVQYMRPRCNALEP